MLPQTRPLDGVPVLVVDDLPLDVKLTRVVLADAGCEVRCAPTLVAAMEILSAFRPRLIVLDVRLPGGNGFDFTRRMKAEPETRAIVIVAVSAYHTRGEAERAGCDAFIGKPIDVAQFPGQIARCLAGPEART